MNHCDSINICGAIEQNAHNHHINNTIFLIYPHKKKSRPYRSGDLDGQFCVPLHPIHAYWDIECTIRTERYIDSVQVHQLGSSILTGKSPQSSGKLFLIYLRNTPPFK